jgi:hypothetical protein
MYTGLKHTHYSLMILLLIALLWTSIRFFMYWKQGNKFGKFEKTQALVTLIVSHVQLLLGLALYFIGPWTSMFSNMGEAMKDSSTRLLLIEHPLTMIIGIVLITIGYSTAKRMENDGEKFKRIAIFYGIALLLILIRIPWSNIS